MIKVYFKGVKEYCYNGCSCCPPLETVRYTIVDYPKDLSEDLHEKLIDVCGDTSEKYRCLVGVSYTFSGTSLEYYQYLDWCYELFNYEELVTLLNSDGVEVIFLEDA